MMSNVERESRRERVRHEWRFRLIEVVEAGRITPRMMRVVFQSEELAGFSTDAFDDHIRLFFPRAGAALPRPTRGPNGIVYPDGVQRPDGRDYTPRAFDAARNRLTVDLVLHGDGPGSSWAARVKPGDVIGVAGPQNSQVVRGKYDWHLLVGDETALPAIGRRIDEIGATERVVGIVEIADRNERQAFPAASRTELHWVERASVPAGTAAPLLDAVRAATLPAGTGFAFVAAENTAARAIRKHLVEERGLKPDSVRAYRFWQRGSPDLGQSD